MDYLKIAMTSLISIAVLFILTKLIGNRQLSELSMFDYINGITIGSIAAEMATSLEKHWAKPMLAMIIYGFITAAVSWLCTKSVRFRRLFEGRTVILFKNGKFCREGLKKARLDINEFLLQSRTAGYFDLNGIDTAIMEQNGKISFLEKADSRPATVGDLGVTSAPSSLSVSLVIDGEILEENLIRSGYDKAWLLKQAALQNIDTLKDVAFASVNKTGTVSFYKNSDETENNDLFM